MSIREDDRGYLWEHLVLDILKSAFLKSQLYYWRDKSGYEIDFVIQKSKKNIIAIECKINPDKYETKALAKFRKLYKQGKNLVVCPYIEKSYQRKLDNLVITFCSAQDLLLKY